MEARARRDGCRCALGAGVGAVQRLPGAVHHLPGAVWLIDGAGAGRYGGVPAAAMTGYWFGLGDFVPGLNWIGYAFLVDAPTFAWLTPFAGWACRPSPIFTALALRCPTVPGPPCVARARARGEPHHIEWLRGHALTGFPWNAFGYALSEPLALARRRR